ncbi:hypothetical protein [Bacillus sp. FJAT-29937]|uniref:hypothetical protein n=1 Tax=Bacillus sp. FJAT-29937 TaxID=1720553 RepID=UPI00082B2F9B|nr:hypothetical protein [Bacillus sp. FJAT-29937]
MKKTKSYHFDLYIDDLKPIKLLISYIDSEDNEVIISLPSLKKSFVMFVNCDLIDIEKEVSELSIPNVLIKSLSTAIFNYMTSVLRELNIATLSYDPRVKGRQRTWIAPFENIKEISLFLAGPKKIIADVDFIMENGERVIVEKVDTVNDETIMKPNVKVNYFGETCTKVELCLPSIPKDLLHKGKWSERKNQH